MKLSGLKKFINAVERKYGKKALKFRVEVHHKKELEDITLWIPDEIETLAVATYPKDKENGYPSEKVLVIR
jgi:hypothetical protein